MPDHNPRIHFTISSHGYGHLSQSAALAGELIKQMPDTVLRIQCNLAKDVIAERLGTDHFEHEQCSMDIGLIQKTPIAHDLNASYQAYQALHKNLCARIDNEAKRLQHWHPDLLISDIPYLPIAAAGKAGIPSVALASLSWDNIISSYFNLNETEPAKWFSEARAAYGEATLALLPAPAMNGECFHNKINIPPILVLGKKQSALRSSLKINANDNRPLIFCSLGGITGAKLPLSIMQNATDFHWLIHSPNVPLADNIHHLDSCSMWPYKDIIASVDAVISKPGYGMAVEAAAHGLPFIFFRRGHFPDEPYIIDWLHKNARTKEISSEDWSTGRFIEPLIDLFNSAAAKPPVCNGAEVGTSAINNFLFKQQSL